MLKLSEHDVFKLKKERKTIRERAKFVEAIEDARKEISNELEFQMGS